MKNKKTSPKKKIQKNRKPSAKSRKKILKDKQEEPKGETGLAIYVEPKKEKYQVVSEILDLISVGYSTRKAVDTAGISRDTWFRWLREDKSLSDQYVRAKEFGLEAMAEDILAIADDTSNDTYTDENGKERCDNEVVQRSRLKIDARKWLMSKLAPKKYGDKVALEGPEGGPLQVSVVTLAEPKGWKKGNE
ncbi:MAG: hypothetical protein LBR69_03060 [Endomicrobium sp.]|jgi:hypothetical protein|nr:hypothetical protein [Endomicrobium sp.]